MNDLLWTKGTRLRVMIDTVDARLFDECRKILNQISAENSFKLQLHMWHQNKFIKPSNVAPLLSVYDRARYWGKLSGVPTIHIGDEKLYVDALAVKNNGPVRYKNIPYEICEEVDKAQENDPAVTRKAHIEQTVVLFDPTSDDIYSPTRQLWGEIALCEGMPLNYIRRGQFDTIFIPEGIKGVMACNLRRSDIGRIAGKDSITTPLYRALHDIYFYLINRFQPF